MLRAIASFLCIICVLFTSCQSVPGKVTKEEALAAGLRLEAIIKSGNAEAAAAFFDMPAMYEIFKKKSQNATKPAIKAELTDPHMLTPYTQLMVEIAKTGSYQLLRSYEKNGRQRLLFRTMNNGDINYQDYQLIKVNNVVKAEDMLNYMTGEDLSSTMATAMDALMDIEEKDKASSRYVDTVKLIRKLALDGKYYSLKEIYERLPQDLQRARGIMTMYVDACRNISGDASLVALSKAVEWYPDSPGAYLYMTEIGVLEKDYAKTLFALNKLDEITGGDPYLDHYRAGLYWLMGKKAETKAHLEKVYTYDPEFVINTRALLRIYTLENETEKAKKIITAYKTSKGFNRKEMDTFQQEFPQLFN